MSAPNSKTTPLRVLCVSTYFPEHGGGVERVAHDLAEHFAAVEGWQTLMAAHGTADEEAPAHNSYDRFALRCWNGIENATGLPVILPHPGDVMRMLRHMREHDLVMVHEEIYFSHFVAILWAQIRGKPLVVVKHTGRVSLKNPVLRLILGGITRFISIPMIRRAARTVFVTRAKRENYDPSGAISNAVVVTNGIDTNMFNLPAAGTPRGGVIYVGRFVESKGMEVLRRITEEMPETQFTLVGWGPVDPRDWGRSNVTVVEKPARSEIAGLMGKAEVALVPSFAEGLPLVALEALACGTRVIVSEGLSGVDEVLNKQLIFAALDLRRPDATSEAWVSSITATLAQEDSHDKQIARRSAVCLKNSLGVMGAAYADIMREAAGVSAEAKKTPHANA